MLAGWTKGVEPAGARTGMGISVPGDIMDCPCGVSRKCPGLGSHIEGSGETSCGMTGGMTGVTNVAVVGVVLVADNGAGCPSGIAIFPWRSLLGCRL